MNIPVDCWTFCRCEDFIWDIQIFSVKTSSGSKFTLWNVRLSAQNFGIFKWKYYKGWSDMLFSRSDSCKIFWMLIRFKLQSYDLLIFAISIHFLTQWKSWIIIISTNYIKSRDGYCIRYFRRYWLNFFNSTEYWFSWNKKIPHFT